MNIAELKDYVKQPHISRNLADDFLDKAPDYKTGKPSYICPFCGNGSGSSGTGVGFNTKEGFKHLLTCFSGKCGKSGDIITFIGQKLGVNPNSNDFPNLMDNIAKSLNITLDIDQGKGAEPAKKKKDRKTRLEPVKDYIYHDLDGRRVKANKRFLEIDVGTGKPVGKTFRQIDLIHNVFKLDELTPEEKNLLYRADLIQKARETGKALYIVEGEKDVETLESKGLCATTSGSSKDTFNEYHLKQLEGVNKIRIIPDNDEPGHSFSMDTYEKLLSDDRDLKMMTWAEGMPEKYDITDFLEDHPEKAEVIAGYIEEHSTDDIEILPPGVEAIEGIKYTKDIEAEGRVSKYQKVVDIALLSAKAMYYTPSRDRFFIVYDIDGIHQTYDVESSEFTRLMIRYAHVVYGVYFLEDDVKKARTPIQTYIEEHGEERNLYQRIASKGGKVYIDLCNKENEIVQIAPGKVTIIESKEAPVVFRRSPDMGALPRPVYREGKLDYKLLKNHINITDPDDFNRAITYVLGAYRPDLQAPILSIDGRAGSGKTTIMELLRNLIDPSKDRAILGGQSMTAENYPLLKDSQYLVAFDNLSSINTALSDLLCMTVTKAMDSRRKMYTNAELITFKLYGSVMINGLSEVVKRQDLIDRSIFITPPPLKGARLGYDKLKKDFKKDWPYMIGSLFHIVSMGLQEAEKNENRSHKTETDPRLKDFFDYIAYCCPALNWEYEYWETISAKNQLDGVDRSLESNLFVEAIITMLETHFTGTNKVIWIGTNKELLRDIAVVQGLDEIDPRDTTYPKVRNVKARLKEDMRAFEVYDINVDHERDRSSRYNLMTKAPKPDKWDGTTVLLYNNQITNKADRDKVRDLYTKFINDPDCRELSTALILEAQDASTREDITTLKEIIYG